MSEKRKVILVTDGDLIAKEAVETAARNIGARCISCSWGNPTRLTGEELAQQIMQAKHDPVVVMVDDRGFNGEGPGEAAIRYLAQHPDIEILGVVAVASNTEGVDGISVDQSIDNTGEVVNGPVDKNGFCISNPTEGLRGDTVEVLEELKIPVIVGIGDIGKMCGNDAVQHGAPLTTKALQEVLKRSGYLGDGRGY